MSYVYSRTLVQTIVAAAFGISGNVDAFTMAVTGTRISRNDIGDSSSSLHAFGALRRAGVCPLFCETKRRPA